MQKEGSVEPVALRRYQHKPMAVIVLQHHPISCEITLSSMEFHQPSETTTETYYSTLLKQSTMEIDHREALTTSQELFATSLAETDTELCTGYCLNDGHCFLVNSEMGCRLFSKSNNYKYFQTYLFIFSRAGV